MYYNILSMLCNDTSGGVGFSTDAFFTLVGKKPKPNYNQLLKLCKEGRDALAISRAIVTGAAFDLKRASEWIKMVGESHSEFGLSDDYLNGALIGIFRIVDWVAHEPRTTGNESHVKSSLKAFREALPKMVFYYRGADHSYNEVADEIVKELGGVVKRFTQNNKHFNALDGFGLIGILNDYEDKYRTHKRGEVVIEQLFYGMVSGASPKQKMKIIAGYNSSLKETAKAS